MKSNGSVVAVPEVHFIRPKWHLPYQAIGYSKNENDFYYYQGRSAVIMNHYGYVKHWIQEENNIQNFRRYENKLGQNRYVLHGASTRHTHAKRKRGILVM
ncbi:hypothetical protein MLOOGBEN_04285 [Bacillus sp. EB106-08-02-XG196]|uniref:hypothetical protein n=1 Tax=Bacillus sp. EB106-08-02-XG196 TaxID=2737049 RepID=UPI0017D21132|nr:hypothetical protein [Bacillus sp. EB106-08-02-XG196]NWQ39914.1 hypothetical protein [Bacillus sp. EB106-08-02-XG196]